MKTAIVSLICCCAVTSGAGPLDVCQLFDRVNDLNGRILRIRGELRPSPEGLWLAGTQCKHVSVGGLVWPAILALDFSSSTTIDTDPGFVSDRKSLDRVPSPTSTGGNRRRVFVTYVGLFETRPNWSQWVVTGSDGRPWGIGFGHLNTAPGRIILKVAEKFEIQSATGQDEDAKKGKAAH